MKTNEVIEGQNFHLIKNVKAEKKFHIPESCNAEEAIKYIKSQFKKLNSSQMNLGSYSTTIMEEDISKLIPYFEKYNLVNQNEYPVFKDIIQYSTMIFSELFNAPKPENVYGTSTVGSSEAILLSILNMKFVWKRKGGTGAPNIVIGNNTHSIWKQFATFLDIEPRFLECDEKSYTVIPHKLRALLDENTIGVCATLGNTFTGLYDDVESINFELQKFEEMASIFIPLHVDAASGGFVAPFITKNIIWDFRLEHVVSINVSSHKFGFVYPSLGWILWKDKSILSDQMKMSVDYLTGQFYNVSVNFSRSAGNLIAQYYNFLTLGFEGYKAKIKKCYELANYLRDSINQIPNIEVLKIEEELGLPVVILSSASNLLNIRQVVLELERKGWKIPCYALGNKNQRWVCRIVVRGEMTKNVIARFIHDFKSIIILKDRRLICA